ncbi:MAG: hypothetical protein SGJ20_07690 [Planctomycetota bacterium]|nr:hypothetical protein [Planctomycetota bacterium]
MSALTDFFVASNTELAEVLPDWLPVADQPVTREVRNPFTGQMQVITEWPPAIDVPEDAEPGDAPQLGGVLHTQLKGIDHVKLAQLWAILTGGNLLEHISELTRPALIEPAQTGETGLHRLPNELVQGLATITNPQTSGTQWSATEEMQRDGFTPADCEQVLQELVRLAKEAKSQNKGMYFWWNM